MKFLVLLASLSLGADATAVQQRRDPVGSLTRARAVFERIDADGDSTLSPDEATSIGIPAEHLERHDSDGDLCLSRDEFSVYYYYLIMTAAEGVETDLANEVARLSALRRTREDALDKDQAESAVASDEGESKTPTAGESLERARKLVLKLTDEGKLSKEAAKDFRPFFWGKAPRELDPEQSAPAFARANEQVDELLASGAVGRKQARLLRATLDRRAGPEIVRSARAVEDVVAAEVSEVPEELGITLEPADDELQSVGVGLPPVEVDMTASTEELLEQLGEPVDEEFIGPLQWSETPEGQATLEELDATDDAVESELDPESPVVSELDALDALEPVEVEVPASDSLPVEDWEMTDAPLEIFEPVEDVDDVEGVEEMPATVPSTPETGEDIGPLPLPENVEPVQESVTVGLPAVDVDVTAEPTTEPIEEVGPVELPFFIPDVAPPASSEASEVTVPAPSSPAPAAEPTDGPPVNGADAPAETDETEGGEVTESSQDQAPETTEDGESTSEADGEAVGESSGGETDGETGASSEPSGEGETEDVAEPTDD